jgi:hypothetical protein
MKAKIILLLLFTLFNCEKVKKKDYTMIKEFKYKDNCHCVFTGEKEDVANFIYPINTILLEKGNINLEILGNSFLFSFDNKNVKMYDWNSITNIFETNSVKNMSVQLDSYRKYKMTILKDDENILKIKVFSDGQKFTEMKSYIIFECGVSGNDTPRYR